MPPPAPFTSLGEEFTPHLTVAKASRAKKRRRTGPTTPTPLWFDARSTGRAPLNPNRPLDLAALGGPAALGAALGLSRGVVERPSHVQLCSLFAPKDDAGYYHVVAQLALR